MAQVNGLRKMIYSTDVLNQMKELRQRFKEEGLGILKLSDPELLDSITAMARSSESDATRYLAFKLFRELGIVKSPRELYPEPRQSPIAPKYYRGVSLTGRKNPEDSQLVVRDKTGARIYRGHRVA